MRRAITRTANISVRVTPEQFAAAQLVADATCRTVSTLMQFALLEFIRLNHPAALEAGARIKVEIVGPEV